MRIPNAGEIPGLIQHLSYVGIFVWFLITQLIIVMPIPEEAVLLSIGYVAATGVWNPFVAAAIALATLLLADNVFYFLSKSGNRYVARLVKRSEGGAFSRAESQMRRNMPRTVFTLTFIPRLRFFGPVLAGVLKLRWLAFFLADASALAIHVSVYLSLGYFFHGKLLAVFKRTTLVHHVIFIAGVVVIGVIVGIVAGKRWGAAKERRKTESVGEDAPPAT
jgi:membrane protein DedA with SNARE-associated domain